MPVGDSTFLEAVLVPHRCYYESLKGLFPQNVITGMAHITGGGIRENLDRILPKNLDAAIDLGKYRTGKVFGLIQQYANSSPADMLRTFNLGIGLNVVCRPENVSTILKHLESAGEIAYPIGQIVPGTGQVECTGSVVYGV